MALRSIIFICIALILALKANGTEYDESEEMLAVFEELESKHNQFKDLQHDKDQVQMSMTAIRLKDDLIESYKHTIESQNITITELNNRILDLKIINRIANNLQIIRSDINRLSCINEDQLNDTLKNQMQKIEILESEANLAAEKLQVSQNLTTDISIKELETKNVADELLETQNQLSECHAKLADLQGNATNCIPFGYETGIHQIQFPGMSPFAVLCNGEVAGPGWTVIQQRSKGDIDFYRNWTEYKNGFGSMDGDFFIGLEKLYRITNYESYELYVQLEKFNGTFLYARYDNFVIGNLEEKYVLKSIGKMTGTAEDWLRNQENLKFTTFDQDNDDWNKGNCANKYHGGWWYKEITGSNLNGILLKSEEFLNKAMHWGESYALKSVKMLIRPKNQHI